MNLQGRDLKRDMRGDDVALLQRALMLIGHEVPVEERRDAVFGAGTVKAVKCFLKERGMEITGMVDAQTARAIKVMRQKDPTGQPATTTDVVVAIDQLGIGQDRVAFSIECDSGAVGLLWGSLSTSAHSVSFFAGGTL